MKKGEERKAPAPEGWPEVFLEEYSQCGIISKAAKLARVDRRTVYQRRDAHADFAKRMRQACTEANERLEVEAVRRAVNGTLRPVFYKGERIGNIREYSDTLLIFLMKAWDREKYGDKIDVRKLDDDTVLRLLALAEGGSEAGSEPPAS